MVARENTQNQKTRIHQVEGVVSGHSQHKPAGSTEGRVGGCNSLVQKPHNCVKDKGSWVVPHLMLDGEKIRGIIGGGMIEALSGTILH